MEPTPESTYIEFLNNALDAVFLTTPDGGIVYANPAACDLFGYTLEEFRSLGRDAIIDASDPGLAHAFEQRRATGKFSGVIRMLRKDRTPLTVELSSALFRSGNGELRTSMFMRDVTEHLRAEQALRESERSLRTLLDTMAEGVALNEIVYDDDGEMVDYRILRVNAQFYRIADYAGKPVVGNVATRLYGMTNEFIRSFWREHRARNMTAYAEMQSPLQHKTFFIATSPFIDDKFVTSFIDITERKQAEEALRKEAERGMLLLELNEIAPRLTDRELYDFALACAVRLTGSAIGFFHLLSEDQRNVILTTWNGSALGGCSAEYDTHYPIERAGNWVDCVRLGHPVIYNDYPSSPNRKGLPPGHAPVRRFMSIPVIEGEDIRFIFGVGNKEATYDDRDIVHIQLVAYELQKLVRQRRTEESLRTLNGELEQRIRDRTKELEDKNRELERLNRVFVGRELKMTDLKEKIAKLERKLSELQSHT